MKQTKKTKGIIAVMIVLISSSLLLGMNGSADPSYLENKLVNDMEKVLDTVLGKKNYVASVAVELKENSSEKVNRTLKPVVEESEDTVSSSDSEEKSEAGFPNFLSPSLIDLNTRVEEAYDVTNVNYKPVAYEESVVRESGPKQEIRRIIYTVIINEKEKEVPGYEEGTIRKLLGTVIRVNSRRGDKLEIIYSPFTEGLFDLSDIGFEIKVWLKKMNAPMWMVNSAAVVLLVLAIIGAAYMLYKRIFEVIKRWEGRRERRLEMEMKRGEKKEEDNDGMKIEDIEDMAKRHPEHFATMIKDWVEE